MDEKEQTTQGAAPEGAGPSKQPGDELVTELTELADRFANEGRVAGNCEHRHPIERDEKAGND